MEEANILAVLHKQGLGGGLTQRQVEKSAAGFRNRVYFAGEYAVKFYPESNRQGMQKELWFYQTARPSYSPALLGFGENYIVLQRLEGHSLFALWREMKDAEREEAVARIAEIVLAINRVDFRQSPFAAPSNWAALFTERIRADLTALPENKAMPESLAKEGQAYLKQYAHCLQEEHLCVTYADLHFDNLICTPGAFIC